PVIRAKAREASHTPLWSTAIRRSYSLVVTWSTGLFNPTPALLTRPPRAPNSSWIRANISSTWASSETSVVYEASAPCEAAARSRAPASTSFTSSRPPARTIAAHTPAPTPSPAAPVTRIVLPLRSTSGLCRLGPVAHGFDRQVGVAFHRGGRLRGQVRADGSVYLDGDFLDG